MRILILGGSVFLGRHLVMQALARGHELSLFHRGKSNPGFAPAGVEVIHGDRDGGLEALGERHWDAVIDTCGYYPRVVRQSAQYLRERVSRYLFVSSISVYAEPIPVGAKEDATLGQLPEGAEETITGETYGPFKALCEQEVQEAFAQEALIVRPGLIVGPHDPSDRFSWWVKRLQEGGRLLAPGDPQDPVQFVDVRDLASWCLDLLEERTGGVYHATGPANSLPMVEFLQKGASSLGKQIDVVWASEEWLLEQGVAPYHDLPLWVPQEGYAGHNRVDCGRALKAGLRFRPVEETVCDTLAWLQTRATDWKWRAGLSAERESELIAKWEQESRP